MAMKKGLVVNIIEMLFTFFPNIYINLTKKISVNTINMQQKYSQINWGIGSTVHCTLQHILTGENLHYEYSQVNRFLLDKSEF